MGRAAGSQASLMLAQSTRLNDVQPGLGCQYLMNYLRGCRIDAGLPVM